MASLHIRTGTNGLPLDLLLSTIPSLPRAMLDRLVERVIDCLDEMDGDSDEEDNGDDFDRCVDDHGEDERNAN